MDKSILVQYTDMQEEIKDLKERIEELDKQSNLEVTDSVKGSTTEHPYTFGNCIIHGIDVKKQLQVDKLKTTLKLYNIKLLELQNECELFIENVKDSKMRQILRYRIFDKFGWIKIGHKTELGEEASKKKFQRFFNNL